MDEKVVVVTGGGNGIGRAYCHGIDKEGGAVVVADINGAAAEGVAKAIADSGGKALSAQVDVANSASCSEMAKIALDGFGKIDGLINNAAIFMSVPVTKGGWQDIGSWPSMSKDYG
jgi:3-oxoacyl-[acyl-carrier protein] reductase